MRNTRKYMHLLLLLSMSVHNEIAQLQEHSLSKTVGIIVAKR